MEKKNCRLAPSLLAADFYRLGEQVQALEEGGCQLLHVDVMDGHFVPNISFGNCVTNALKGRTKVPFDVHLMIENPDQYIPDFVTDQTEYITVHAEACTHLHRTVQLIHSLGVKAGVALNPATSPDVLDWILPEIDMVLVMSVNPGFGGQKFIPSALDKIRVIREKANKVNPDLAIEVDGGINPVNLPEVKAAGADTFVTGSALLGAKDLKEQIKVFMDVL